MALHQVPARTHARRSHVNAKNKIRKMEEVKEKGIKNVEMLYLQNQPSTATSNIVFVVHMMVRWYV